MAAPYTPFNRSDGDFNTFYFKKYGYKQAVPKTDPLPYDCEIYRKVGEAGVNTNGGQAQSVAQLVFSVHANAERIRCYEKFKDRVGPRAQMSENLAELSQSLSMLTHRAGQLYRFSRRLYRFDFIGAARELETPVPSRVGRHRKYASNWLEYHLGWEPAVNDIGSAIEILQNPIKDSQVTARTSSKVADVLLDSYGDVYYCSGEQRRSHTVVRVTGAQSCMYQASVRISNPNLYLANSLGFVNPVVLAWQLVPLSFVIDWFTNVEQFLSSGTDWMGLDLVQPFTSEWGTYNWRGDTTFPNCSNDHHYWAWRLIRGLRSTGIAAPGLGVRAAKVLGWQRGLTAISLLTGYLRHPK